MKNLIIIRHAKSSWDAPLQDIDRPLAMRGINDAHLISSKIMEILPRTFIIWSSPAKRASETAIIFTQNISCPIESIVYKDELYTFDLSQFEKVVKSFSNEYDCVIVFGHNDAITGFVNKYGDTYIDNVPTTGLISMNFNTNNWQNLEKGNISKTLFPKHFR